MKQNSLTIVENHEIKLCPQKTRSCIKLTISENCLLVPTYLNDYKVDMQKVFVPTLFSPLLPLLSAEEFKTLCIVRNRSLQNPMLPQ